MDRDTRKVTEEAWLICPNWTEVRCFTKNKNNKDKFFDIFKKSCYVYPNRSIEMLTNCTY